MWGEGEQIMKRSTTTESNKSNKPKKIKNRKKIFIIGLPIFILNFFIISFIVDWFVYKGQFTHADKIDTALYGGYFYEDFEDEYEQRIVNFKSGDNQLTGYIYGEESNKAIVVVAHGIGGGADSYFAQEKHFIDQGYCVFAYDCTGSYMSEGKTTNGFPQAVLDLNAALNWLNNQKDLNDLPVLLFGHSWGGYAVANVLNYDHNIAAVVSISGINSAFEIVNDQVVDMTGAFGYTQIPTLNLVQLLKFGRAARFTAVDGINSTDIPILIVHGKEDTVIPYDGCSIISHKSEIKNPNVSYITTTGVQGYHNSLYWSKESLEYLDKVNAEYSKIYEKYDNDPPYEERVEFISTINDDLMAELNPDLFDSIDSFFENAIEK